MEKPELPLLRRALPPGKQLRVVLIVVLAAAGAIVIGWGLRARASEPVPANEVTATNEVRLSSAQLSTLGINIVSTRSFRTEEVTDGQIALNGDTTTQVFSPYSGRVVRVLPGMQAAFVDIGLDRAAFLYVADVRTDLDTEPRLYFDQEEEQEAETESADKEDVPRALIQDLLQEGQMIMVQVAKDPLGTKGARITTHVSLAGRHVVYMPTIKHLGISRRIEEEAERERPDHAR